MMYIFGCFIFAKVINELVFIYNQETYDGASSAVFTHGNIANTANIQ